jgi:enterochelin esterase-like enzyme
MRLCLRIVWALCCAMPMASRSQVLSTDSPLTMAVSAGAQRSVAMQLSAGDFVAGTVDSGDVPLGYRILAPDGRRLRDSDGSAAGVADFSFRAVHAGTYVLHMRNDGEHAATWRVRMAARVPYGASAPVPAIGHPDSPRLRALQAQLASGGTTEAFWRQIAEHGAPLVEPGPRPHERRVTFVWRGADTRNVQLLWPARSAEPLSFERLGHSDVWFRSILLPSDTRLSYRIAVDVPPYGGDSGLTRRAALIGSAQADPLNPQRWGAEAGDDDHAHASALVLPDAPPLPWSEARAAVPAGQVVAQTFTSRLMGNTRRITVYLPSGHDRVTGTYPLLVLFDEDAYLRQVPTPAMLDRLIAAGAIPPTVAVLIANPTRQSRAEELPCNARFADALADELLPQVRTQHGAGLTPATVVLAGSSYGGLAAACGAFMRPDAFGKVLSMSGSFWWSPPGTAGQAPGSEEWLPAQYAEAPRKPIAFYLAAGAMEHGVGGDIGILESTRHLHNVLRARGYRVRTDIFAGGHDYIMWQGKLADGLIDLLGTP